MIVLGKTYKDTITGFQGVCTGLCQYLTGYNQALLSPPVKEDGSYVAGQWWDEQRLVLLEAKTVALDNGDNTGCDIPAPVR